METITVDGRRIAVERVHDRGWEGIAYRDPATGACYLCVPRWWNGAYIEETRPLPAEELERFRTE